MVTPRLELLSFIKLDKRIFSI